MLISIIIPIYKVEPYIIRCIDSVLNQTYRELEVILVDDCSPDRSMAMAQEYIETSPLSKDLQFVYLKHEKNRGLSAARNTGVEVAKGEYIFFLDSDDELEYYCIDYLVKLAEKYKNVDIVQGNIQNIGDDVWNFNFSNYPEFTNNKQWIKQKLLSIEIDNMESIPSTSWNKLFRTNWFVSNHLFFKEGIIHEDEHWRFMYWDKVSSIAFCKETTYRYLIRNNSIMTKEKYKDNSYLNKLNIYKEVLLKDPHQDKDVIRKLLYLLYATRYDTRNVENPHLIINSFNAIMHEISKNREFDRSVRLSANYMLLPFKLVKWRIISHLLPNCS